SQALTEPYTLSLHDALPISQRAEALDVAWEDALAVTPEFMLAQIDRAERTGMLAKKKQSGVKSAVAAKRKAASALTSEAKADLRSEEHTSELQSLTNIVCRL